MTPFANYDNNHSARCQQVPGQRSLYEELSAYNRLDRYPFHMPGHKGNRLFLPPVFLPSLDVTELAETDNLHEPSGCIAETQRRIADIYSADESFLLVNGSTAGIIAAVCAACGEGEVLAVDRNCHRSVYSGMILSGARPRYFWPSHLLCSDITFEPDVKAVIVTGPTYEGDVPDIRPIAEAVHKQGGILIVDEAHGAHFPFHPVFPEGALKQGADIVINSFHKTLPAFTQSAVLHVKGGQVDIKRLRQWLSYVQTSSPSYLIMASTDYMLDILQKNKMYFESYVENLLALRKSLEGLLIPTDDIGKLLLAVPNGQALSEAHNLAFEMITDQYILAITSVADTAEGFKRLQNAIILEGTQMADSLERHCRQYAVRFNLPEVILSPREAAGRINKKTKRMRLTESVGEVAGSFLAPFPPGIPILAPGEKITEWVLQSAGRDCEIDILLL